MFIVFFSKPDVPHRFQFHVADEALADEITVNYRRMGFSAWVEKA